MVVDDQGCRCHFPFDCLDLLRISVVCEDFSTIYIIYISTIGHGLSGAVLNLGTYDYYTENSETDSPYRKLDCCGYTGDALPTPWRSSHTVGKPELDSWLNRLRNEHGFTHPSGTVQ